MTASSTNASAAAQKAIVKSADMSEELQSAAIDLARDALQKFETERDIAKHIKASRVHTIAHISTHTALTIAFLFISTDKV